MTALEAVEEDIWRQKTTARGQLSCPAARESRHSGARTGAGLVKKRLRSGEVRVLFSKAGVVGAGRYRESTQCGVELHTVFFNRW